MVAENILSFLTHRGWHLSSRNTQFIELSPPDSFRISSDFKIHLPVDSTKTDFEIFINNILEIIGEFYSLTQEDLNVILKKQNSVLKVRVYDEQTEEGRISLIRFEEFVEKIKSILSDTASFVIDKSVTSTRVPEEVSRYLKLCNFMQTERGSFVAKIQLPSKEIIKDRELLGRNEIYSEEINHKLSEILTFVNENILEGDNQVTEEYLIENANKINIKLYKDIGAFFEKANLKNIDFTFHNLTNSSTVVNENITKQKLYKLTQFVEKIESHSYEVGNYTFKGKIITLKSKDPDGLKNSVIFTCIFDNLPMVVTANLDSEYYKFAIEAHKMKQYISITGLAKKTKTRARIIEITNFEVED